MKLPVNLTLKDMSEIFQNSESKRVKHAVGIILNRDFGDFCPLVIQSNSNLNTVVKGFCRYN